MNKQHSQPTTNDINENIYTAADLIAKIAAFTSHELNNHILNGNYVVLTKTLDLKEVLPKLPTGWHFQYISRLQNGHYKQLVILPSDKSHQRTWNQGLYAIAANAGLKDKVAINLWAKWRNVAKFEYLPYLIMMLEDERIREHYLDYDPEWSYTQFMVWRDMLGFNDNLKTVQRWDMIHLYQRIIRLKAEDHPELAASLCTVDFGWSDRYSSVRTGRPIAVGFD